jgi:hypothetical protein
MMTMNLKTSMREKTRPASARRATTRSPQIADRPAVIVEVHVLDPTDLTVSCLKRQAIQIFKAIKPHISAGA